MIKAYVANLGRYNEGHSVGGWIELPTAEENVASFLKDTVKLDSTHEEYAIHDYETDLGEFHLGEFVNLTRLNSFTTEFEKLAIEEQVAVQAYVSSGFDFTESLVKVSEEKHKVFENCKDMGDVAKYILTEDGTLDLLPAELQQYFDLDEYGSDLECNINIVKIEYKEVHYYVQLF